MDSKEEVLSSLVEQRKQVFGKIINLNDQYLEREKCLTKWKEQLNLIDERIDKILNN